jgi:hypothetical protein
MDTLKDRLTRYRQITITVIGKKPENTTPEASRQSPIEPLLPSCTHHCGLSGGIIESRPSHKMRIQTILLVWFGR